MKAGEKQTEEHLKSEIGKIAQFLKEEKQAMDKKSLQVENQLREVRIGEQKLQQAYTMLLDIIEASSSTPTAKDQLLSVLRKELPNKFENLTPKSPVGLISQDKENKQSIPSLRNPACNQQHESTPLFGNNLEKKLLLENKKRDPLSIIERLNSNLKTATHKQTTPKQRSQRSKAKPTASVLPKESTATDKQLAAHSRHKLNTSSSQDKFASKLKAAAGTNSTKSNLGSPKSQMRTLKPQDATRTVSPVHSSARETVDKIFTRLIKTRRENSQDRLQPADSSDHFITISDPNAILLRSSLDKSRPPLVSPRQTPTADTRGHPVQPRSTSQTECLSKQNRHKSQLLQQHRPVPKININLSSLARQPPSIEILSTHDQRLHIKQQKHPAVLPKQLSERCPATPAVFTPKKAGPRQACPQRSAAETGPSDPHRDLSPQLQQACSSNRSDCEQLAGFNAYFDSHQDIYASAERRQTLQRSKTKPTRLDRSQELNFYRDLATPAPFPSCTQSRPPTRRQPDDPPREPAPASKLSREESRERMSVACAQSSHTGRLSQRTLLKNPLSSVEKRRLEESAARELARKSSASELQQIEQVQSQINWRLQTLEDRLTSIPSRKIINC